MLAADPLTPGALSPGPFPHSHLTDGGGGVGNEGCGVGSGGGVGGGGQLLPEARVPGPCPAPGSEQSVLVYDPRPRGTRLLIPTCDLRETNLWVLEETQAPPAAWLRNAQLVPFWGSCD